MIKKFLKKMFFAWPEDIRDIEEEIAYLSAENSYWINLKQASGSIPLHICDGIGERKGKISALRVRLKHKQEDEGSLNESANIVSELSGDAGVLYQALCDNPDEALEIARHALLGLFIDNETGRVVGMPFDYPAGADYIEIVSDAVGGTQAVLGALSKLQFAAESS